MIVGFGDWPVTDDGFGFWGFVRYRSWFGGFVTYRRWFGCFGLRLLQMVAMIFMASSATNDNLTVFQIHHTDDDFGIQRLLLVDWDCVASFGYK